MLINTLKFYAPSVYVINCMEQTSLATWVHFCGPCQITKLGIFGQLMRLVAYLIDAANSFGGSYEDFKLGLLPV